MTYQIIDGQTGARVGKPYQSRTRARARVDALDNAYGAYRYRVEPLAPVAEVISLEAARISRALRRDATLDDIAIEYGLGQF